MADAVVSFTRRRAAYITPEAMAENAAPYLAIVAMPRFSVLSIFSARRIVSSITRRNESFVAPIRYCSCFTVIICRGPLQRGQLPFEKAHNSLIPCRRWLGVAEDLPPSRNQLPRRSEERRVGKEWSAR